ncbi:hypothetical protein DV702_09965 [Sporosarcina sp. PTS2304]|uniref:CotY/CotZ family spore coat protein n=1 Tax=Sporosarcina sp. PTS2304 TaxID=2283194 RepID=UPI000E0E0232|nr:CotY/CotZ family spore coat protein [Sporosarcina sp. PTS2304]AXI00021.1 hypothetical protein DV702_09965 [Sporosarcina sp. PTS2304]
MKECCLNSALHTLWNEQLLLSTFGKDFQFICDVSLPDTIPFMLQTKEQSLSVISDGGITSYFRLDKMYEDCSLVRLSMLQPVDMEGHPAYNPEDLYALKKTSHCILVDSCCFCAIIPLSPKLVDRPLPIIESKT